MSDLPSRVIPMSYMGVPFSQDPSGSRAAILGIPLRLRHTSNPDWGASGTRRDPYAILAGTPLLSAGLRL